MNFYHDCMSLEYAKELTEDDALRLKLCQVLKIDSSHYLAELEKLGRQGFHFLPLDVCQGFNKVEGCPGHDACGKS